MAKVELAWREPASFKKALHATSKRSWFPWPVLVGFLGLFPWYKHRETSGVSLWFAILLCLVAGLVLWGIAGFLDWAYRVLPTEVQLLDGGLVRHNRPQPAFLPYDRMASFTIHRHAECSALRITMADGSEVLIGMGPSVDHDALIALLERKGLRHDEERNESESI